MCGSRKCGPMAMPSFTPPLRPPPASGAPKPQAIRDERGMERNGLKQMLTPLEVAPILGIGRTKVFDFIASGEFESVAIGWWREGVRSARPFRRTGDHLVITSAAAHEGLVNMKRKSSILLGAVALTFGVVGSACGGQGTSGPPTATTSGSRAGSSTTPGSTVSETPGVPAPIAVFPTTGGAATCPAHQAAEDICLQTVSGPVDVAGLGRVSEQYILIEEPTKASCVNLHSVVRWDVAGKGTINFAVRSQECLAPLTVACDRTLDYVVTGGSGAYKHVTGRGILEYLGCQLRSDTWIGTLSALHSAHE